MFENAGTENVEMLNGSGRASSQNLVDMTNPSEMRGLFGNQSDHRGGDASNSLTMTNPYGDKHDWQHL
jgi:hypothetical protein